MASRDCTPLAEDGVDKLKADTQRYYDELVALGGRPTGPIQHYPSCKTTMADSMRHYRDEYETIESIFEVDKRRAVSHWGEEMNKWGDELLRWQRFKEYQRVQNRSELDLEKESTDAALAEVLSKLSDWQGFEVFHDRKVYAAEAAYEKCQQRHAANQNAMVGVTSADATPKIQKPYRGWTYYMGGIQEELEDLQKRLVWVRNQWTEVIAEACSSIAAAPKLQEELEAKFETQANALYRCLQQAGARPSRALQSPDINAELPQRIQQWNSEISIFTNELWDWKIFKLWRRRVRDSGNTDQEGRKLLSQGDSCSELFEDLVKYKQQKLDRAISWVNCWRHRARQYVEARKRWVRYNRPRWPAREDNDYDDGEYDKIFDETEVAKAKKAGLYASHAEKKVSVAARMLKESKQKLRDVLAESDPASTAEHPAIQRPPTPPKSQSPESLPGSRRPSNVREPAGNGHRRMANTNPEQHALPPFSSGSNRLKEHDDNIEMSDHAKEPNQADSQDTVMSDVENPPNYSPSPLTESQPRTTANKDHRKLSSPRKGHRRSKKERARKGKARVANINTGQHALPPFSLSPNHIEEHNDGIGILDHMEDLNPVKIKKEPNQADSGNMVMSDVEDLASHLPQSPPESQPRHTANRNHRKLPSSSAQGQTSRKTRSSTKLDQVSSGKILKKPSKNKPLKKTKDFTDQQTTALLDIALTSSPSTDTTSLGRNEPESYTKPTANTNHRALPSLRSPISTSRKTRSSTKLDQAASDGILKKSKKKPLKKAKAFTEQQTMALLDATSTSFPSTGLTSLGRDIPESYPRPTTNTNQRESAAAIPQTPRSSYPSTGPISLGNDIPESYPKLTADTDQRKLSPPSSQPPTSSYPSTGTTSLGRNIPESYPKPTADTGHSQLSPPSSQTPTSRFPPSDPTSLGRKIPESYTKPSADIDHRELPPPSTQTPMSRKPRVDQVPPGKILKKPSKNKPSKKAAKVFTEASTGPTPPRRSERLKLKAVAASKRSV